MEQNTVANSESDEVGTLVGGNWNPGDYFEPESSPIAQGSSISIVFTLTSFDLLGHNALLSVPEPEREETQSVLQRQQDHGSNA